MHSMSGTESISYNMFGDSVRLKDGLLTCLFFGCFVFFGVLLNNITNFSDDTVLDCFHTGCRLLYGFAILCAVCLWSCKTELTY